MPRGWVYEPVISNYESLIFYNALQKHPDSFNYQPIAIAKREETGIKYRYLCIAMPKVNPFRPSHFADIEIYKPEMGRPYATCIYKIDFDKMFPHRMPYL
ncbi:MAG: hypothetical protein PHF63_01945 [Herbinix sp.]|nr:hypothetical protein [Herbinix sp.]